MPSHVELCEGFKHLCAYFVKKQLPNMFKCYPACYVKLAADNCCQSFSAQMAMVNRRAGHSGQVWPCC